VKRKIPSLLFREVQEAHSQPAEELPKCPTTQPAEERNRAKGIRRRRRSHSTLDDHGAAIESR